MDADLRERDAFVERLLKKEKRKTRRLDQGLSSEQIHEVSSRGSPRKIECSSR